jgi:hypothetical protein
MFAVSLCDSKSEMDQMPRTARFVVGSGLALGKAVADKWTWEGNTGVMSIAH